MRPQGDASDPLLDPISKSCLLKVAEPVEIYQVGGAQLRIFVQEFDTENTQLGSMQELKDRNQLHPYALSNLEDAKKQIRNFVDQNLRTYMEENLKEEDLLSRKVFHQAVVHVQANKPHSEFLENVLRLWTAARTIEGGWIFKPGSNSLGLQPKRGARSVQLTQASLIDFQFSGIMYQQILLPLRKAVLGELRRLTHAHTRSNWFVIFLANFILLHTYTLLMNQQVRFARKRRAPNKYSLMNLIRSIHHGAKTLLYHFHCIRKNATPFSINWASPLPRPIQRMAELDDSQVIFLRDLTALVREKLPYFEELYKSQSYEDDYWFTGQLFLPNWSPPDTINESPPADAETI